GVSGQLNTRYVKETVVEESLVLDLHTASDITSGAGSFTVTPPKGGVYILRLTSVDSEGREVITERFFYVTGSDWYFFQGNESDEISLQPDKDEYAVGETAQILLNSPIPQGQYLMTIEREGIFSEKIIELTEPSTVLEIPIEDTYVPIVYVALSSYTVRTGEPVHDFSTPDLDKPKGLFGTTALYVNTDSRSFDIEVIADKTSYRPGDTVELTVKATKNNEPVDNAEITLMAVDRGVIDLINYHVPNPVEYFYADYKFSNHVRGGDSRSLLIDPVTYEVKNLFGGDASATENSEKTETRDNFDPTAVFEPYLVTDENGIITHSFTLPDTLTSYRITAVGVKENNFSLNESEIDVNNPISVRDVLPRRLREGDISETGVVISNLDSIAHDVTVDLAIFEGAERSGIAPRNDGLLRENGRARVEGNATYTIRVEPNSTESIMFFMEAQDFGFVTVEFTVTSDILNERILQPLEIDRPYMYETVTTVGKVLADNQERENIIIGEYADITLSLASDLLGTLNDSVQYVFRYPYGCLEQRLSAMLPLTVFADYIDAFGLSSEVSDPKQVVETELQMFAAFQNTDGGFPYWSSSKFSSLSVSMRFAEFLVKAQENGIEIPNGIDISALATYIRAETLKAYEKAPSSNTSYVATQRAGAVFMRAYGLYVTQKLLQNQNISLADIPFDDEGNDIASLSLCGLLYLNQDNIEKAVETEKRISTYLKPTTRGIDITPVFDSSYSAWSFFNTTSEQYALLLQFYTALNAHNLQESYTDISDRLIYELSQQQKASHGYWQSTATTARVLIAIDEYIKANDLTNTDIIAKASLKGENILFGAFEGLGNQPITRTANFAELAEETGIQADEENTVTFDAEGEGSIFYTLSMRYPIDVCEQTYRDEGLNVFVDIKDAQTGESVSGDNLVAGNVYRAIVTLSSTQHRNFVALRVPIPSGAEVINASFVTTGNTAKYAESETEAAGYTYGLSNQAIYDNEVQYFWDYLRAGYRQVDFLFR
ncbi:MAG: alpha-2-macroglobulin family protein, partial [Spirochaetales bacterium]